MWLMLSDCFLSIVSKSPAGSDQLLVRARRPGDIEKVFGRRTKVVRSTDSDYLFRAVIDKNDITNAIQNEVLRITYPNFKDSVGDEDLHDAYLKVWTSMSMLQDPRPYSGFGSYWNSGGKTWGVVAPLKTPSVVPAKKRKQKKGAKR